MAEIKKDSVSIIIVTWNSAKFIADCLESILEQSYRNFEIIVVDNNSEDETVRLVQKFRKKFKRLKIIKNEENAGFAAGNNIGLRSAVGEYVLFLNPDTRMDKDFIKRAISGFDYETVGAVSGLILRFDGKTIDSAGQSPGKNRRPIERGYGKQIEEKYLKKGYCFSVCGAAALYKMAVIEKIKIEGEFFDEEFFAFYEDLDVGWRMNLFGYRCRYMPDAVVYHHRGGSRSGGGFAARHFQIAGRAPQIQANIIRNRWYTILKNDSLLNYLLHLPWIAVQEMKTAVYLVIFRRDIIINVYKQFFIKLPSMWKKRKINMKNKKTNSALIRKRM